MYPVYKLTFVVTLKTYENHRKFPIKIHPIRQIWFWKHYNIHQFNFLLALLIIRIVTNLLWNLTLTFFHRHSDGQYHQYSYYKTFSFETVNYLIWYTINSMMIVSNIQFGAAKTKTFAWSSAERIHFAIYLIFFPFFQDNWISFINLLAQWYAIAWLSFAYILFALKNPVCCFAIKKNDVTTK